MISHLKRADVLAPENDDLSIKDPLLVRFRKLEFMALRRFTVLCRKRTKTNNKIEKHNCDGSTFPWVITATTTSLASSD